MISFSGDFERFLDGGGRAATVPIDRFRRVGQDGNVLDLYLLGTLDLEERLKATGTFDGFIPGEGAAFLWLARPGTGARRGVPVLGRIEGAATAEEAGHRYSKQAPYRGDGLDAALKKLTDESAIDIQHRSWRCTGAERGLREMGWDLKTFGPARAVIRPKADGTFRYRHAESGAGAYSRWTVAGRFTNRGQLVRGTFTWANRGVRRDGAVTCRRAASVLRALHVGPILRRHHDTRA